jgi:transposase
MPFNSFGAVPQTITYDNLKNVVKKVFEGKNPKERDRFVLLRAYYLFDSHFCDPAKGRASSESLVNSKNPNI